MVLGKGMEARLPASNRYGVRDHTLSIPQVLAPIFPVRQKIVDTATTLEIMQHIQSTNFITVDPK